MAERSGGVTESLLESFRKPESTETMGPGVDTRADG